jgi:hypothetical protein
VGVSLEARIPSHLDLAPVKRKTKKLKRIQAEDAGPLQHWYDQPEALLHNVPARLVYNFDECGFQPSQGRARNLFGSKSSCPDLAESEKGENITALKCISADGWVIDLFFIFKASGKDHMESWYYGSERLPSESMVVTSPNGWISDELALSWLFEFAIITSLPDLKHILGMESSPFLAIGHTGGVPGSITTVWTFPDTQSAVVAMTNGRSFGDASDFAAQILI